MGIVLKTEDRIFSVTRTLVNGNTSETKTMNFTLEQHAKYKENVQKRRVQIAAVLAAIESDLAECEQERQDAIDQGVQE